MSGTGATIYELKFHNRTFGHASGVNGTLLQMTDGGDPGSSELPPAPNRSFGRNFFQPGFWFRGR